MSKTLAIALIAGVGLAAPAWAADEAAIAGKLIDDSVPVIGEMKQDAREPLGHTRGGDVAEALLEHF